MTFMPITESEHGTNSVFLTNDSGFVVEVSPFGATIRSLQWHQQELTLTYPKPQDYLANPAYLGATVGRYANRIAQGRFHFQQQEHHLATLGGSHCLHGGDGFSHRLWQVVSLQANSVELFLHSPDQDQGFPGDVSVWQRIWLDGQSVHIEYRASTQSATILNLTNHCYFNLDGRADIQAHQLQIFAAQYLPIDATLIPVGQLQTVADTPFDFRKPSTIGDKLLQNDPQLQLAGGFDHCYVFAADGQLKKMARLYSPHSGIALTVSSTLPGMQFYSGQGLTAPLSPLQGLCLEAQFWPNSPNQTAFPSTVLSAGQVWSHRIVYDFSRPLSPN